MAVSLKRWNTYHTKGIRKKYLFRYMDESKVISFLESQSIYMAAMTRFEDKLEGISTYDITEVINAYEACFMDEEKDIKKDMLESWKELRQNRLGKLKEISKQLSVVQNCHFVSCWFNSDKESHGMWSYYAKENGFAVKIDRKELQNTFKNSLDINLSNEKQGVVVGRIKYQDFPNVILNESENQVLYKAFRKDDSFAHEKEYRFVLIDTSLEKKEDHFLFKLTDFDDLKITIKAHPKMCDKQFKNFKNKYHC